MASVDDSAEPSDTTATVATTAATATKQKPSPSLRLLELGAGRAWQNLPATSSVAFGVIDLVSRMAS